MPTLDEVMSRSLLTVPPTATVAEAATLMSTNHVGSALVCEDERLLGIFTERDIVKALASDFDAAGGQVTGWMTADPTTLGPGASVAEALDLMLEQGFRHVPVVDGERVIGIVSLRDLTARSSRG
jgi:CBS domain-containing protein